MSVQVFHWCTNLRSGVFQFFGEALWCSGAKFGGRYPDLVLLYYYTPPKKERPMTVWLINERLILSNREGNSACSKFWYLSVMEKGRFYPCFIKTGVARRIWISDGRNWSKFLCYALFCFYGIRGNFIHFLLWTKFNSYGGTRTVSLV